jgi:hypothetical protein
MFATQITFGMAVVLTAIGIRGAAGQDFQSHGQKPQPNELKVVPSSPWTGAIKHRAVEEFPLPRDRSTFGIGEEIEFRIDPPGAEGLQSLICWHVLGNGTVYPIVGSRTIGKVDLVSKPSTFQMKADRHQLADRRDSKDRLPDADVRKWLRDQATEIPKRSSAPIGPVPAPAATYDNQLQAGLRKIDGMRRGKSTEFKELDTLGQKLLAEHLDPVEQGQIYYHLAHVHAQSGLVHPEQVANYAKKALACPLEPLQVPRLYVYWGDAQQVARAGEARASTRRWSSTIYLTGLADVLRYPMPAAAPNLPGVDRYDSDGPDDKLEQRHARQVAARSLAKFEIDLVQHRNVLVQQLSSLYKDEPAELEEIRILASAVLQNAHAEERLLRAMQGRPWEN